MAEATLPAARKEAELFDLTAVVKAWAINSFYAAADKKQKKLKVTEIEFKVIWDDVVCWSEPPTFTDSHSVQLPKCHALFSTSYRNKTDGVQEYNFRTDRSTRSTAEIEITKGFTAHRELGVKFQLPNQVLEANAGFSKEISLSKTIHQCFEEEMTWGIDTRVEVQPKSTANVEVNIIEQRMTCQFAVDTRMRGRVRAICLECKRNNAFLMSIEADLGEVVKAHLDKRQPSSTPKLTNVKVEDGTPKTVVITTEGRCAFRFGVKQDVEVNQIAAPYPNEN
ncbi:unnamed protein product [Mesocestoides corti]|uniref:Vitellogenin domain-containing protein n=1 Tax=Mesocestoides corti TaxID=53468 RepID=A0A0R3U450_MESCO|nr:unnamed protein product [Mesocestoides corti]